MFEVGDYPSRRCRIHGLNLSSLWECNLQCCGRLLMSLKQSLEFRMASSSSAVTGCKLQVRCYIVVSCLSSRRHIIASTAASLLAVVNFNYVLTPILPVRAESDDRKEEDDGVVGAIKSLLDPNKKTKSGKVLPKAYVKSVREVVKTLRESL
ncbi:40S ribosomal protein S18-like [Hibiscus syriacus]|uniref:40S ribosomal protein S18-like n=1 Tax=Hibiscus syriacus TaxID=106335 RepID=A0A6A3B8E6_HIBSY|nr:40S ribosomal protein S18-like [Hibiscus syriacus]